MWRLLLGTMGVKSLVQGLNAAATSYISLNKLWSFFIDFMLHYLNILLDDPNIAKVEYPFLTKVNWLWKRHRTCKSFTDSCWVIVIIKQAHAFTSRLFLWRRFFSVGCQLAWKRLGQPTGTNRGTWAGPADERTGESELEKCVSWFSIRNDRYPPTHH